MMVSEYLQGTKTVIFHILISAILQPSHILHKTCNHISAVHLFSFGIVPTTVIFFHPPVFH